MIKNEWDICFFKKAELFPQASVRIVFSLKDRLVTPNKIDI